MLTLVAFAAGLLALASLPYWLPAGILALRMRIFTRINGPEGLAIPESSQTKTYSSRSILIPRLAAVAAEPLFRICSGIGFPPDLRCTRSISKPARNTTRWRAPPGTFWPCQEEPPKTWPPNA